MNARGSRLQKGGVPRLIDNKVRWASAWVESVGVNFIRLLLSTRSTWNPVRYGKARLTLSL